MVSDTQYDLLWSRYLELFRENTRLMSLLQKGENMNESTEVQTSSQEDAISKQMAAAVADNSPDGKSPIVDVETETPVEVEHVYVQTDEEIGGIEVKPQ